MSTFRQIRRMLAVLVTGGAIAGGMIAAAGPAQAEITPFKLSLTAMHSNKVLAESSNIPGTAVVQRAPNSSPATARQWRFDFIATATVRLVNEESGMCMTPEKANEISYVRMQPCGSAISATQVWKYHVRQFNGQTVNQWTNQQSQMCLDVGEASQANEAKVIQFPCTDGPNQLFKQTVV